MSNTKKPLDKSELPSWQDLVDMLASWCELATEAELPFRVQYYESGGQLQVLVDDIDIEDGGDGTHLVTVRDSI